MAKRESLGLQCIDGVKGHIGVNWGQPEVTLLRNVVWLPNLVGRTSDQSVIHCWGQRSCRGQSGSTRGQLLRNALWLPNLVRTPDQGVIHCWGHRSCRGQLGSNRGQIA